MFFVERMMWPNQTLANLAIVFWLQFTCPVGRFAEFGLLGCFDTMRHPRPFIFAALAVAVLLGSFVGCGTQKPKQQGLPDAQVRQLATKYRDEWLAKSTSEDAAVLACSTIVSVERQPWGWHITFMTPTGHNPTTPERIHDYYLHVYITPSGELDRIVRGPDILS